MIDQLTVDKIIETSQTNIIDVVSDFVSLRKRGVNYIGNCPFHNEKTPSFTVSPHKGIYKCFGCGKGGNAVNFVMDAEQMSFLEAIKFLGNKFHIHIEETELTEEQKQIKSDRDSMIALTAFAQNFFTNNLLKSDEGRSVGLAYLRERGFRDDIIEKFELGYSPVNKKAFTQEAIKNGFKEEFLQKTGLSIIGDNYKIDRFNGRVIFPIHNISGRPIAFGGRVLRTDVKTAKYLNSPESEIYHKSNILYGISHAKKDITKEDKCFLVEGYTDVISFHQAGITNVTASSGTALTEQQILLIARFSKNITIVYDGDAAGIKASLRGIDMILSQGMNVRVLLLPEGEDPDSFAKSRSKEDLLDYIEKNEGDFIKFKTNLLIEDAKNDPIKRANLLQDIVKSISVIPDVIIRNEYIKECSNLLNTKEEVLYSEITKINRLKRKKEYKPKLKESVEKNDNYANTYNYVLDTKKPFANEEYEIIRFLVKYGDKKMTGLNDKKNPINITVGDLIIDELHKDNINFENDLYKKIVDLFQNNKNNNNFIAEKFFTYYNDPEVTKFASEIISSHITLSRIHERFGAINVEDEHKLEELTPKTIHELKLKQLQFLIKQEYKKLKEANEDKEKSEEILKQLMEYEELRKHLAKVLGGRTIIKGM